MKASGFIRQEIAKIFARASEPIEAHARCGPCGLRLGFASRELAGMRQPAYIQSTPGHIDLEPRFITADHHELSALVPDAAEKPRL